MKSLDNYIPLIKLWASDRGIDRNHITTPQISKTVEEVSELLSHGVQFDASMPGSKEAIKARNMMKDDIGDIFVTLVILCQQRGLSMADCVDHAYNSIANRKGKTVGGVFIKDE
jgi:NTP pyrophosphatase (non-canonical NTP hydrolase)